MGDRANVYVPQVEATATDPEKGVYIYSHWGGAQLPHLLRDAIRLRWRWADPTYLTRIIYDKVVGSEAGEETGYGIGVYMPDNEHLVIRVDTVQQTVAFHEPGRQTIWSESVRSWSFMDYANLSDAEIDLAWRDPEDR